MEPVPIQSSLIKDELSIGKNLQVEKIFKTHHRSRGPSDGDLYRPICGDDQVVLIDFYTIFFVGSIVSAYSFMAWSQNCISLEDLATGALLWGIIGVTAGLTLTLNLPVEEQVKAWQDVFLPMIYGVILKMGWDGMGWAK